MKGKLKSNNNFRQKAVQCDSEEVAKMHNFCEAILFAETNYAPRFDRDDQFRANLRGIDAKAKAEILEHLAGRYILYQDVF